MSELSKRLITGVLLGIVYLLLVISVGIAKSFLVFAIILLFPFIMREFCQLYFWSLNINQTLFVNLSMFVTFLFISIASLYIFFDPLSIYFDTFTLLPKYLVKFKQNISIFVGLSVWFTCFSSFILLLFTKSYKDSICAISYMILGCVYIIIPAICFLYIYSLSHGPFWLLFIVWATSMSDICAYFCGKLFGKHKIGWQISPCKTYEGYIGGLIFQVIMTTSFHLFWDRFITIDSPSLSTVMIILFSILFYFIASLGDLIESAFKRALGVKDSSNILPGHGGLLDLLDSFLISIPIFLILYFFI